jgi:hypothetical protein
METNAKPTISSSPGLLGGVPIKGVLMLLGWLGFIAAFVVTAEPERRTTVPTQSNSKVVSKTPGAKENYENEFEPLTAALSEPARTNGQSVSVSADRAGGRLTTPNSNDRIAGSQFTAKHGSQTQSSSSSADQQRQPTASDRNKAYAAYVQKVRADRDKERARLQWRGSLNRAEARAKDNGAWAQFRATNNLPSSSGPQAQNVGGLSFGDDGRPPNVANLGEAGYRSNAYGLGVYSDASGRPFQWETQQGQPVNIFPVQPNAYGPGVGMDPFGRPVQAVPFGR